MMNKESGGRYYREQIKGLILILDDAQPMITTEYVIEKLQMILEDGIGFHGTIVEALERLDDDLEEK